jgi:hypothetical protein
MVVECVSVPLPPVMITVADPVAAVADAENVSVLTLVAGFGLKLAVTPVGSAPTVRVTAPVKPLTGAIVTVLVPLPPCVTLAFVPLSEKSGAPVTVRVSVAV